MNAVKEPRTKDELTTGGSNSAESIVVVDTSQANVTDKRGGLTKQRRDEH